MREEIERLLAGGSTTEKAFVIARKDLGNPQRLKTEFKKTQRNTMKKTIIITSGIVGMAFVMPAIAQYNRRGALQLDEKLLLPLGLVMTLGGIIAITKSLLTRRA